MSQQTATQARANYGIDAPDVIRRFVLIGAGGILFGVLLIFLRSRGTINFVTGLAAPSISIGCTFLLMSVVMIWGSRVGKLSLRDRLINGVSWRGDEKVLDVGCGHGLMLIAAARRLTTGVAIGVDIWQKEDQAGNSASATIENARVEGVARRVQLVDGDARSLPFEDDSFDVVLSSWALHNIYDKAGREQALSEIVRVLKRGGRLAIVDIRHAAEYAESLREAAMSDVKLDGPNFIFVIPSYKLTASKNSQPDAG